MEYDGRVCSHESGNFMLLSIFVVEAPSYCDVFSYTFAASSITLFCSFSQIKEELCYLSPDFMPTLKEAKMSSRAAPARDYSGKIGV